MRTGKPEEHLNETGHVTFDDRGQAIWEWSMATGRFETATTSSRLRKLTNAGLSLVEDAPPAKGKKGYDPYDSGGLSRTAKHKTVRKGVG